MPCILVQFLNAPLPIFTLSSYRSGYPSFRQFSNALAPMSTHVIYPVSRFQQSLNAYCISSVVSTVRRAVLRFIHPSNADSSTKHIECSESSSFLNEMQFWNA